MIRARNSAAARRISDQHSRALILIRLKQAEEALMADILQFRPRWDVFAPELTSAMGDAYDKAIASLSNNDSEFAVRELVAKRIIRSARRG